MPKITGIFYHFLHYKMLSIVECAIFVLLRKKAVLRRKSLIEPWIKLGLRGSLSVKVNEK